MISVWKIKLQWLFWNKNELLVTMKFIILKTILKIEIPHISMKIIQK